LLLLRRELHRKLRFEEAQISFRQARLRLEYPRESGTNVAPCALLVTAASFFFSVGDGATLAGHQVQGGGLARPSISAEQLFPGIRSSRRKPETDHRPRCSFFRKDSISPVVAILIVTRRPILMYQYYGRTLVSRRRNKEAGLCSRPTPPFVHAADSLQWRLSILTAGLRMIRTDWPQSAQWPVAFAGFSGGAKRSGILAAMLASNRGFKICGMFLAGINSDRVTAASKIISRRQTFEYANLDQQRHNRPDCFRRAPRKEFITR